MPDAGLFRLGELGTFSRGQGGTKKDARPDGVPCIRYGDLYTAHEIRVRQFVSFIDPAAAPRYTPLRAGDIVFAASGETHSEIGRGAVFTGDETAVVGGDTIILSPKPGTDPVFLSYAANTSEAARFKARRGQGSSVIHIGARHLEELPVWLPPLSEQRRIAEILDTVDEAIRKTEEIITKLEQVKQGLLHDLLTRGIDDNGELRDPDRHPEQFKDSLLGPIPNAWEVVTLGDVYAERSKNGLYKPAKYHGRGPLMVQMGNIFRGLDVGFVGAGRVAVSATELANYGLREGDLLFGRRSLVLAGAGKCALVRSLPEPATFESSIVRVRLVESRLLPSFAALYLGSARAYGVRRRFIRQVAVSGVSSADIADFSVPVPSLNEQRRICERMDSVDSRISDEVATREKWSLVRGGLMEDLLTGRVRVTPLLESAE